MENEFDKPDEELAEMEMDDPKRHRTVAYIRIGPTHKDPELVDYIMADLTFTDRVGSKTTEHRPQLKECLKILQPDDEMVVHSIDKLARNTKELVELVKRITDTGASIHFENEGIELGTNLPGFKEKFALIKGIHDAQQALALERRKEGLVAAKQKGVRLGRPTKVTDEDRAQIRQRLADGERALALAKEYGVSESLVYQIGRSK